jgi:hypothetical protein
MKNFCLSLGIFKGKHLYIMEQKPKREYQKRLKEEEKRKTRYFTATEAQWQKLLHKAAEEGISHSLFIINKLKLDK